MLPLQLSQKSCASERRSLVSFAPPMLEPHIVLQGSPCSACTHCVLQACICANSPTQCKLARCSNARYDACSPSRALVSCAHGGSMLSEGVQAAHILPLRAAALCILRTHGSSHQRLPAPPNATTMQSGGGDTPVAQCLNTKSLAHCYEH